MSSSTSPNVQRAVHFFRQAHLSRLLSKLRERYIELGRVGGQVLLEDSTPEERRNIASLLGKPPYQETTLKVRLADVDKALRQSGFACELPDVLDAFFPHQPLITRPEQRTALAEHQTHFRAALEALVSELPEESQGRRWLLQGTHGLDWLFAQSKNQSVHVQAQQLDVVRTVARALNALPSTGTPERLGLFAQRIAGDPHFFDADRTPGRLLRYALMDLTQFATDTDNGNRQTADIYAHAGLLVDTLSSNVAVFHLAGALYHDGTTDPLSQAAGERVLLLPLRQLLEWQSVTSPTTDIYCFENPQVFEEVIAGLSRASVERPLPTLICTAGWPSTAALLLLDLLMGQSPVHHFHYSGDFDLAGLKIADYLMERYPQQCHLWRFDANSYLQAIHNRGVEAHGKELTALQSLPEIFALLVATMQEKGKWAYQEGLAHLLIEDIKQNMRREK